MAANIVEAAQLALRSPHQQQRFTMQFEREKVSWIRYLAAVARDLPAAGEDSLLLPLEDLRRDIQVRRQGPGSSDFRVDGKVGKRSIHKDDSGILVQAWVVIGVTDFASFTAARGNRKAESQL